MTMSAKERKDRYNATEKGKRKRREQQRRRYYETGRTRHLRRRGVTPEQYQALLDEQGGVCAICGNPCSTGKSLAIDHDHETDEIRGLLCFPCNTKLGWYENHRGAVDAYLGKD